MDMVCLGYGWASAPPGDWTTTAYILHLRAGETKTTLQGRLRMTQCLGTHWLRRGLGDTGYEDAQGSRPAGIGIAKAGFVPDRKEGETAIAPG